MPELIDTTDGLRAHLDRLRDEPALALDTETDAYFAYRPSICLLQLSVPGLDLLIDPLADGIDLAPLGELIADPARETVLHAAENDVILMQHQYGWRIGRLFDTQVASFVLGLKPYSLAGILESRFDTKLDKSQQRSDWAKRPLTEKQVRYAAEDTRHLLELADDLKAKAREQRREEEIAYECRRIAERDWEPEPVDLDAYRKMSGARDLDAVGLRILRGLFLLRNDEAERRNWAPFRIAPDHALMKIARERLTAPAKGIPQPFWRRYGRRVQGIVKKAPELGPVPERPRKRTRGEPTPAAVKRRFEALRKWRTKAAEKRGVEPFVVARNELLAKIAAEDPRDAGALEALLEPFRFREYGEAMLGAMLESS